jgi:hypothetical protein
VSDKPKKRSRWVKDSGVDRYPKALDRDLEKYRPQKGWKNGARVYPR